MSIRVTKTLPASSWYSGSGSTTITLSSVTSITIGSKKSLTKIQVPQSKANYTNSADKGINWVKDLKKVEDTIKLKGWLSDNTTNSAWQQAWKLRGMEASGGPFTSLIIEDLTFGTGSQQAFLERVNFIGYPARTMGLTINETSSSSIGKTRIEVDLDFYLGDAR